LSASLAEFRDSGEGRWTILAAIESTTPAPVLSASLYQRFTSRGEDDFAGKILSAMRSSLAGTSKRNQALNVCAMRGEFSLGKRMSTLHSNEVPQKASPCVMVIFGASGDLTKRNSFPLSRILRRRDALAPIRDHRLFL